jgi:Holliday junction resolvasome RuvABC endonuclease subunit
VVNVVEVVGLDPGFAACGVAVVALARDTERVISLDVVRTKKSGKKRKVLDVEDNVRRSYGIAVRLFSAIDPGTFAVCAEAMSSPRSSRSARLLGMTWGSIVTIAMMRGIPILQASPQEIKRKLCGKNNASKKDVQAALMERYGTRGMEHALLDVKPDGIRHHACDALAAVVACLDAPSIMMARRGL